MDSIIEYHNLTVDELYHLQLPLKSGYRYYLDYDKRVKYSVYMIKKDEIIIQYTILSYHSSGIKNYYDKSEIISKDIKWFIEWTQTTEGYENMGYGKKIISHITNKINAPITLVSLDTAKIFWSRCGFRLLHWEAFTENDSSYMICHINDMEAYKAIHDIFYPGYYFVDDGWYLSLCLSGEITIEEYAKTEFIQCLYDEYDDFVVAEYVKDIINKKTGSS